MSTSVALPAASIVAWRRAHAASATVVGAFVLVHLANHVVALGGVAAHLAFMQMARQVYRQPAVEIVLLGCVAFQVASGLAMVATRRWPRAPQPRLQVIAGLVLALFLLVHVGAVLAARAWLALDTTFYFAAAGLHAGPWAWFFAPYYAGAVIALFVHLGCAVQRRRGAASRGWRVIGAAAGVGALLALAIIGCLAGVLTPVDIPARYLATYALR